MVGLYPAHALGYELVVPIDGGSGMDDDDENDNDQDGTTAEEKEPEYQDLSMFLADNQEDEIYFQQHPHGNSPYLHATDQPLFQRPSLLSSLFNDEIQNTPPLYLDVNPNRNDELDVAWTSHYINDGASLLDFCKQSQTLSQTQSEPPVTEEHIEQYYQQSTNTKNCIHIPFGPSPLLATVTTKKVKKGQELFTSYGVVYWLGAIDTSEEEDEASSAAIAMPGMTEKIQSQILESARDLQKAMEGSKEAYGTEISNLEAVFGAL